MLFGSIMTFYSGCNHSINTLGIPAHLKLYVMSRAPLAEETLP